MNAYTWEQLNKPVEVTSGTVNEAQLKALETVKKQTRTDIDHNSGLTTVLIVDDNHELRDFLVVKFSSYFKVLEADDGKEVKAGT